MSGPMTADTRGLETVHKTNQLIELIAQLGNAVPSLEVLDHRDAGLCAVGIAAPAWPARLIYLSCYEARAGHAHYALEVGVRRPRVLTTRR